MAAWLGLAGLLLAGPAVRAQVPCVYEAAEPPPQLVERVQSSKRCEQLVPPDWPRWPACPARRLRVALNTETVHQGFGYEPYIRLNMTAQAKSASSVLFFYQCMKAPDQADLYCHDNTKKIAKYGSDIVPCRGFHLKDDVPADLSVVSSCFRIFGLSQYRVTVVVLPDNCRAQLYVTMPLDYDYNPKIHHFFDGSDPRGDSYERWSPMLFVDTTPSDGVWVRFEEAVPSARAPIITLHLYRREPESGGGSSVLVAKSEVGSALTGAKFDNLDLGDYIAAGFVRRAGCDLHCPLNQTGQCVVCPHTLLNFTLPENKYTMAWQHLKPLIGSSRIVLYVTIVALVLALLVFGGGACCYIWRRRQRRLVALTGTPRVLILYADDCAAHANVVLQLAQFLHTNAHCEVHLDQLDLLDHQVRPSQWLPDQIQQADFVLLVFSNSAAVVRPDRPMQQQRPFPDLFQTGVQLCLNSLTLPAHPAPSRVALTNKFVACRMCYSLETSPIFSFTMHGCKLFELPDQLNQLVGHVHGIAAHRIDGDFDRDDLDQAIREYDQYAAANPDYLQERLVPMVSRSGGGGQESAHCSAELQTMEAESSTAEADRALLERGRQMGLATPADSDEETDRKADSGLQVAGRGINPEDPLVVKMTDIPDSDDDPV